MHHAHKYSADILVIHMIHSFHTHKSFNFTKSDMSPRTEEFRFKRFGSPDYSVCLDSLLSDGDSVYSNEKLFDILRTPEKMC